MKVLLAILLPLTFISAVAKQPAESSISSRYIFSSQNCKITKILTTSDQIDISIFGKLYTSDSRINELFRTGDRFLFSVRISNSNKSKASEIFSQSMSKFEGAHVSLKITAEQYLLRGGIIILGFDTSGFKVTKTAEQDAAANP